MNGRERCLAVLRGQLADRPPVSLHNFQMAAHRSGRPFGEVFRNAELLAEAMIGEWREFGHDMILLEIGTACSAEALGAQVLYEDDRAPVVLQPLLAELADAARLSLPTIESRPPWRVTLDAVRLIRRELGDQVAICGRCDQGPFSLAGLLLGMEQFLMAILCASDPAALEALLSFTGEVAFHYARAMQAAGADCVSFGESFAGPDLLNPADYRRLVWPHERRLLARLRADLDLPTHLHICGHADPILADMVRTGAAVLEVDQKTDLALAKSLARGHCVIHGNLAPVRLLMGTPAEARELTLRALEAAAPGGGFIIGPGCALAGPTPPANIAALLECVHSHGAALQRATAVV